MSAAEPLFARSLICKHSNQGFWILHHEDSIIMRNDCRIYVISVVFVHFMQVRDNCIDFSAYLSCPEVVSNAQYESIWHKQDQMIQSCPFILYHRCLSTAFLFPKDWEWDAENGMEWLIHMCFHFFFRREGKDI